MQISAVFAVLLLFAVAFVSADNLAHQFFKVLDSDGDGVISPLELSTYSFRMDKDNGVNESIARTVMNMVDPDEDFSLSLEEFCQMAGSSCNENEEEEIDIMPQQFHLSPGASDDEIVLSWTVLGKAAHTAASTVEYGTNAKNMSVSAAGIGRTYSCGKPTWEGEAFHVTLSHLNLGEEYWYRVRVGNKVSNTMSFSTPSSQPKLPLRFAVFGDMGTVAPLGFLVARQLKRLDAANPFDSLIHVGDVAYAGVSSEKHEEIPFIWDVYGRQLEPVAAYKPYIITVGNHEKYCNYSSFQTRYLMPGDEQGGWGNFWFSVNRGLLAYISMSTEHDYSVGSPQYQFLESAIAAAAKNRDKTPWIVVGGHRPMYSSDADEQDQHWPGARLQSTIEPLMQKYRVDMFIGGHMHCYERTLPVLNGTADTSSVHQNVYINPPYPVQITIGTAGAFQVEKWIDPQPDWSVSRMQRYGLAEMLVHNATHLQFTFKEQKDDAVMDEFWIVKNI